MPSASPETDPLIGVDPNDTKEVSFGGARFIVGVMGAGDWDVIEARHALARQRATRRAIKELSDAGTDPERVVHTSREGTEVTEADMAVMQDPLFIQEMNGVLLEAARLSVRGHSGFVNRNGDQFEFSLVDGKVAPTVVEVYARNSKLLRALWLHIRELNDMGTLAKKVSPR